MKQNTQIGFGLVEIILSVVVLGMLGLVAWELLSANHMFGLGSQPTATSSATNSAASLSQPLSSGNNNQELQGDLNTIGNNISQDTQNVDASSSAVNDQQNQISVPTN